jgi:hypothetical protein
LTIANTTIYQKNKYELIVIVKLGSYFGLNLFILIVVAKGLKATGF